MCIEVTSQTTSCRHLKVGRHMLDCNIASNCCNINVTKKKAADCCLYCRAI